MWWFGVAVNGVPFDPSGPFWNSDASATRSIDSKAPRSPSLPRHLDKLATPAESAAIHPEAGRV
jgi:hypothetical protein